MRQDNKKRNVVYAIACKMDDEDYEDMFFLTFKTKNEEEAFRLASCVCGIHSQRSLVIITDNGEYYDCK